MCDALKELISEAKAKQSKTKGKNAKPQLQIDPNAGSHQPSGQLTRKQIMDQLT